MNAQVGRGERGRWDCCRSSSGNVDGGLGLALGFGGMSICAASPWTMKSMRSRSGESGG